MIAGLKYFKEYLVIGLDTCVSVIGQKASVILKCT